MIGTFSLVIVLVADEQTTADQKTDSLSFAAENGWSTIAMGGVKATAEQLKTMQKGNYILHARNGQLKKVSVEKFPLPIDPCGHVQRLALFIGGDNKIYAAQCSILSKSADGGKTWTHIRNPTPKGQVPESHFMEMRVLPDGSWIRARRNELKTIVMETSIDEGHTWNEISQIGEEIQLPDRILSGLEVLPEGNVIVVITAIKWKKGKKDTGVNGWKQAEAYFYRSQDAGKTFSDRFPTRISHWGFEINVAELRSGRLLAVIRHQRPQLPNDPPNIMDLTGASWVWKSVAHNDWGAPYPFKNVSVADSSDGGETWSPMRHVTTQFGQCHAAGVGLQNGRVVVVHDHRYPRSMSSARAVVSDDEGQTWRDEVYYLSHGTVAGYARTISLDGQEMLTLTGSHYGEAGNWHDATGNTQFHIIRWRLVD